VLFGMEGVVQIFILKKKLIKMFIGSSTIVDQLMGFRPLLAQFHGQLHMKLCQMGILLAVS